MFKKILVPFLLMATLCLNAGCGNDNNDSSNNNIGNNNGNSENNNDNSDNDDNNNIPPSPLSEGTLFEAEMLGLVPGSTTAELNFAWYSDTGNTSSVRIFNASGELVKTWEGNSGEATQGKRWHKVTAKELKADTQYQYSVSNDGDNWSYKYHYKTPQAQAFRFASVGDPQLTTGKQDTTSAYFSADQTTLEGWKETLGKIASKNVDFIAGVGDQVDKTSGGDEAEYANFFAPPQLRTLPWAPAVGNHDRHLPFIYHYNLPNEQTFEAIVNATNGNNTETGTVEAAGNYWYLYNNTLFVVFNTSAYPDSAVAAGPYVERFNQTLRAATKANQGKYVWLIVQHHKSTASVAQHLADEDIQYYVEAGFEKLMDIHGVDFVLAGHDHVYARSHHMRDGQRSDEGGTVYLTFTTGSGLKYYHLFDTVGLYVKDNANYPYLMDGSFGSAAYLEGATAPGNGYSATDMNILNTFSLGKLPLSTLLFAQHKTPGYALFDVNGNTINVAVYDVDSDTPIDSFSVSK